MAFNGFDSVMLLRDPKTNTTFLLLRNKKQLISMAVARALPHGKTIAFISLRIFHRDKREGRRPGVCLLSLRKAHSLKKRRKKGWGGANFGRLWVFAPLWRAPPAAAAGARRRLCCPRFRRKTGQGCLHRSSSMKGTGTLGLPPERPGATGWPGREDQSRSLKAFTIRAKVTGPTAPSATRSYLRWKASTSSWVAAPNTPSMAAVGMPLTLPA